MPEEYIRLIQDMYRGWGCKIVICSAAGESTSFGVEVRLHKGSASSPYLFLLLMDVFTECYRWRSLPRVEGSITALHVRIQTARKANTVTNTFYSLTNNKQYILREPQLASRVTTQSSLCSTCRHSQTD